MDTKFSQLIEDCVSSCTAIAVDRAERPSAASTVKDPWVTFLETGESVEKDVSCLLRLLQEVLSSDCFQDSIKEDQLSWIAYPGVEDSVSLFRSEIFLVIKSSCQHLFTEGH